jgi:myo-inositol-1(or 4)-monophosphatase
MRHNKLPSEITDDIPEIVELAKTAARTAGKLLADMLHTPDARVLSRTAHDVKMTADLSAEKYLISALKNARPHDGILAEESGNSINGKKGVWIIDPLDGTVNYSHTHPHFCTTIAWTWEGITYVGVVFDPLRNELFLAVRGNGATCNDTPIQCAETSHISEAMLAVGFGKKSPEKGAMHEIGTLGTHVQKLRISGSAALDLAYTACGRYDGYIETQVYTWDIAAGCQLVQEAGGKAFSWKGNEPQARSCIATTALLSSAVLNSLHKDIHSCARTCIDVISD